MTRSSPGARGARPPDHAAAGGRAAAGARLLAAPAAYGPRCPADGGGSAGAPVPQLAAGQRALRFFTARPQRVLAAKAERTACMCQGSTSDRKACCEPCFGQQRRWRLLAAEAALQHLYVRHQRLDRQASWGPCKPSEVLATSGGAGSLGAPNAVYGKNGYLGDRVLAGEGQQGFLRTVISGATAALGDRGGGGAPASAKGAAGEKGVWDYVFPPPEVPADTSSGAARLLWTEPVCRTEQRVFSPHVAAQQSYSTGVCSAAALVTTMSVALQALFCVV